MRDPQLENLRQRQVISFTNGSISTKEIGITTNFMVYVANISSTMAVNTLERSEMSSSIAKMRLLPSDKKRKAS